MPNGVIIYGTDQCEDTQRARAHLNEEGIDYRYVNIDQDPAGREWVLRQNDDEQKTPTIDVNGLVLSVPSNGELDIALRRQRVTPRIKDVPDDYPQQSDIAR